MVGLVKQRLAWEVKYSLGEPHQFKAYEDYKKNRLSEYFRLHSGLEEFFEYVMVLENKVREVQNEQ
jgi:hypothetical protein